jgi:hypothetical protein
MALDLILWGVMAHQFIVWFGYSFKERTFVRVICVSHNVLGQPTELTMRSFGQYWSVIIATATSALGLYYIWILFVDGFGTYINFLDLKSESLETTGHLCTLLTVDIVLSWYGILDPLTTVPVQAFYLERAYALHNKSIWIPILVLPIM